MSLSAKFLKRFRNLKTDSVPRPPRDDLSDNNNVDPERTEYLVDDEDCDDKPKQADKDTKKKPDKRKGETNSPPSSPVNTQATSNVINIVNSSNIHWGPEITYNMGVSPGEREDARTEEEVTKSPAIVKLLAVDVEPEHVYLDHVSKNLGRGWRSFFRHIGYSQGRIETVAEDTQAQYGVPEVRYKLLLDWKRNAEPGTLGALAAALWSHGERHLVSELAALHERRAA